MADSARGSHSRARSTKSLTHLSARVCARLQDKEINLLDDPLASLDANVARFVWEKGIVELLRNRGKLVVIATHHEEFLRAVDHVVLLDAHGTVIAQGLQGG